jgi:hypothetical protein
MGHDPEKGQRLSGKVLPGVHRALMAVTLTGEVKTSFALPPFFPLLT